MKYSEELRKESKSELSEERRRYISLQMKRWQDVADRHEEDEPDYQTEVRKQFIPELFKEIDELKRQIDVALWTVDILDKRCKEAEDRARSFTTPMLPLPPSLHAETLQRANKTILLLRQEIVDLQAQGLDIMILKEIHA